MKKNEHVRHLIEDVIRLEKELQSYKLQIRGDSVNKTIYREI